MRRIRTSGGRSRTLLAQLVFIVVIAVGLFSACTGHAPEIIRTSVKILLYRNPETQTTEERLSLFVSSKDEDGISDLDSLYLLNDSQELYWSLNSETWMIREGESESWIGSNVLRMADGSAFPRGEYRLILEDQGGERVEALETITGREYAMSQVSFPGASLSGTTLTLSGTEPPYVVIAYDLEGNEVATVQVTGTTTDWSTIASSEDPAVADLRIYVFHRDDRIGYNLLSGPFALNPNRTPEAIAPAESAP